LYEEKFSTSGLRKRMIGLKDEIRLKEKELQNQFEESKQVKDKLDEAKRNKETLQKEKDRLGEHLEKYLKNEQTSNDLLSELEIKLKEKDALISELQREKQRQIETLQMENVHLLKRQIQLELQSKEIELKELTNTIKEELSRKREHLLEELLEEQKKIIQVNGSFTSERMEIIKRELTLELAEDRIQDLLNKQEEVCKLKMELELESLKFRC